jgi:TonB family protein
MPEWIRTLAVIGLLSLAAMRGLGQTATRRVLPASSSLEHYHLGEEFLHEDNLQSAANEFRAALNGDHDAPWAEVWSHIQLAHIFDATGQHERAVYEYRQAERTGDNTNGALDEATKYLASSAIYIGPPPPVGTLVAPIQQTDPEYTEEARLAQLEGAVVLTGLIDAGGVPLNLEVASPIGLGLDESALAAAKGWHFSPNVPPGTRVLIPVGFRLPEKQSLWHLIRMTFQVPEGLARPTVKEAPYPIGPGIGPEAFDEGRVLLAIGRMAAVMLTFDVDPRGVPSNFRIPNASEVVWGGEAIALVSQWRFNPATIAGFPIPVPCTVELIWGNKELTTDLERQLHDVLALR